MTDPTPYVDPDSEWTLPGPFDLPVDTATVLVVDPCHIPADVLKRILVPNEHGVTVAAIYATAGDGGFPVTTDHDGLHVEDIYAEGFYRLDPTHPAMEAILDTWAGRD